MCPSCCGPPLSPPPAAFSPPPTCPGSAPRERLAYRVASGQLRTAPPAERLADARTACSFTPCCAAVTATRQSRDPAVTPHNRHERQSSATLPPLRAMPAGIASSGSRRVLAIVSHSAAAPAALAPLASSPLRTAGPPASHSASRYAARLASGLRPPLHRGRFAAWQAPPMLPPAPPLPPPPPLGSSLIASLLASLVVPLASPLSLWSSRPAHLFFVHVSPLARVAAVSPPLRPLARRLATAFPGGGHASPLDSAACREGPHQLTACRRSRVSGQGNANSEPPAARRPDSCLLSGASHPFLGPVAAYPVPSRPAPTVQRTSKTSNFFEARRTLTNLL